MYARLVIGKKLELRVNLVPSLVVWIILQDPNTTMRFKSRASKES
jgi:hypothetical protein